MILPLCILLWSSTTNSFTPQVVTKNKPHQNFYQDERQQELQRVDKLTLDPRPTSRRIPWTLDPQYQHIDPNKGYRWGHQNNGRDACTSYVCEDIEGTIPKDLEGVLYRAGAGKYERNGRRCNHFLDGDGFISSFAFKNGKVRYNGNFVQTEGFKKEEAEGRFFYRNFFGTEPENFFERFGRTIVKNPANHNVVEWGGRLYAFWEAGRVYELDPITLQTIENPQDGLCGGLDGDGLAMFSIDQGGVIDKMLQCNPGITGHPHVVDDDTFALFETILDPWNNRVKLDFVEYNKKWEEKRRVKHSHSGLEHPHDFAISDDYYFYFEPVHKITNLLSFALGLTSQKDGMKFDLSKPATIYCVGRDPPKESFKVDLDHPYNCFHPHSNMKVEGNLVTFYFQGWDGKCFSTKQMSTGLSEYEGYCPNFLEAPIGRLFRAVINTDTKECVSHEEIIPGLCIHLTTVDNQDSRHVYGTCGNNENVQSHPTGYVKVDTETDTAQYWWADPNQFVGEIIPQPKQNGEAGSWLIGTIFDAENEHSSLVILDSENFEDGPVARIHLSHYLALSIHGLFSTDVKLEDELFLLDEEFDVTK